MTLAAITQNKELVTPYRMIESFPIDEVYAEIRKAQNTTQFYCAVCYRKTGKLHPVRFTGTGNPDERRPYFHHPASESDNARPCRGHQGESEKHMTAKDAIRGHLENRTQNVDVALEYSLAECPDISARRPDVFASYPNGSFEAHEIQISPINSSELENRTRDIQQHLQQYMAKSMGVSIDSMNTAAHRPAFVVWYLYGKSYNQENREWAEKRNGVRIFHLWFDGDTGRPKWKEAESTRKPQAPTRQYSRDTCGRSIARGSNTPALTDAQRAVISQDNKARSQQLSANRSKQQWPITNAKGWHGRYSDRPSNWARWKPLETGQKANAKYGTPIKVSKLRDDVVYVQWQERADMPGGNVLSHRQSEVWERVE